LLLLGTPNQNRCGSFRGKGEGKRGERGEGKKEEKEKRRGGWGGKGKEGMGIKKG
jgi:hypothetical protein